jgi:hypothetical protein
MLCVSDNWKRCHAVYRWRKRVGKSTYKLCCVCRIIGRGVNRCRKRVGKFTFKLCCVCRIIGRGVNRCRKRVGKFTYKLCCVCRIIGRGVTPWRGQGIPIQIIQWVWIILKFSEHFTETSCLRQGLRCLAQIISRCFLLGITQMASRFLENQPQILCFKAFCLIAKKQRK